ncbi:ribosomal RNA large subunit methyltransferase G [Vibrio halioticoli NBRC 102217]|uniref:Ribosomal RNA large subunit methyltransferase G n=1 Tax=Vibrio halioticoli NBRC 102217 TaxID=1219072 RepID=V5FQ30_9VIBR|nr:methyltransferase [Vibrio halioticoli]GAD90837.1 ribosomal RNA large subunit methyltransferase G [Vibrio halioticoli NBRC 102217]
MKTELVLHDQQFTLHRYPKRASETLQAWDAGDEYVINHFIETPLPLGSKVLILNDNFGALSCWFSHEHHVYLQTDSLVSQKGAQQNLLLNQCNEITLLHSTDAMPNDIDAVIMQLPKSNRFLTWQLHQLKTHLNPETPVVAVNKANAIHTSTLKLFEKHLGETRTSLAWKKHRLVFSQVGDQATPIVDEKTTWDVPEHNMQLNNLANVYSGESLDLGARFILEHLPQGSKHKNIIDLGCGNGVLSVKLGRNNPLSTITSVDESFMAVESARMNVTANVDNPERYTFLANNCLEDFKKDSYDLVVCNPPFHQQNTVTDHIAWQMFCDAHNVLETAGELLVVGNGHLGYLAKLTRLFGKGRVSVVASNKKFVILSAKKAS